MNMPKIGDLIADMHNTGVNTNKFNVNNIILTVYYRKNKTF